MYIINKNLLKFLNKSKYIDMDKYIEKLLINKKKIGVYSIKSNQCQYYGSINKLNIF